jgi:hypothetical protein
MLSLYIIALFSINNLYAQNTDSIKQKDILATPKFEVGVYLDSYYSFDFNQPKNDYIPYLVSSNHHNELSINLALIDLKFHTERFHARIAPGFGTYMQSNYASEPKGLNSIFESSLGLKLFKNKGHWLDFGVFNSPISNESPVSKDHFLYTRSLSSEYVPYYLAGIKSTWKLSEKLNFYAYLVNGWQQIKDQNKSKSVITQFEYKPKDEHLFNWNVYLGNERSVLTPTYRNRYFTDVYWVFKPSKKFNLISTFYVGFQEKKDSFNHKNVANWWQCNTVVKYSFNPKHSIAARIEYYNDSQNIVVSNLNQNKPFSVVSSGLCYNFQPNEHSMFRLDARYFDSKDILFTNQKITDSKTNFMLTANITVWF